MSATFTTSSIASDYTRDGYVILRQFFDSKEVAAMQTECDRLLHSDYVDERNLRTKPRKIDDALVVERFDPVVDISPVFRGIADHPRLHETLREIHGEPCYLFKDKLIFKLPGMTGYAKHQDYAWWQGQTEDSVLHNVNPRTFFR